MKNRKELSAWAGSIGRSIDKLQEEWNERNWQDDVASLESKQNLLRKLTDQSLRNNVIKRMQEIKDKYPVHLKNYSIPEA